MDERVVEALGYVYCNLSDDELLSEYQLLKNDSAFLYTDGAQELYYFYEREEALLSVLRMRGLIPKAGEPD